MISKEVARIVRVDHAGEFGAISIYKSQLFVAKFLYQDISVQLKEMLNHEIEHFKTFDCWLKEHKVRHCHAIWFWSLGGYCLGLITALFGRKAIWVCTEAVESTVLHHLEWQLSYLEKNNKSAYQTVLSIQQDEIEHQNLGKVNGSSSLYYSPIRLVVKHSTKFAIWVSTKL
ncbi:MULTISPECIES: demethoxyubiquinone hydroxylase family protein [unclassified Pseudoalteromonas]|uniref:demethoxyubiquinone hydroxylase family protein n=1 Tax=unclassified Pseudoalteromonas TaxID=194690 RepID=UPI00110BD7A8|nr:MULTISPECIES: demethoxyubiquinone hydroxylase family protein [unclassified Pseudoalteromonas]TMP44886.1 demethoxyubiquinone hydroxylase family protein [Pseudoalteromonas sp. S1650]TMP67068.1 demethoxyubiquinone hydroxylase family protein [Pseudoalteromonas sp. S1649]